MSVAKYDLIVIAGETGAARAVCFGTRVVLVERGPAWGGAAANPGIPFKALRVMASYLAGFRTDQLPRQHVLTPGAAAAPGPAT